MERDWYRRQTWTEADEADFRTRLARARKENRPQYLRIQAGYLAGSGEPFLPAALALLDQVLTDHPQSLEVATALGQKGECLKRMGDIAAASTAYAASIERMRAVPKMQSEAWLEYAMLVATERILARYSDALEVLDEFSGSWPLMLPVQWFRVHASRALIFAELRKDDEAAQEASMALQARDQQHSGIAYRPRMGLVVDDHPALRERLMRLAGGRDPPPRVRLWECLGGLFRRKP